MSEPPERAPDDTGVHDNRTVHVPSDVIGVLTAQVPPVTVTPVPEGVIADGVTDTAPVFVTVTERVAADPTVADGKAPELNVSGQGFDA